MQHRQNLHAIGSLLLGDDLVQHRNHVWVVVKRALDLVQELRLACLLGDHSFFATLQCHNELAGGVHLNNRKANIDTGTGKRFEA